MHGRVRGREQAMEDDHRGERTHEAAPDVAYRRLAIVNAVLVGAPGAGDREWVLVDSGVYGSAGPIRAAAQERFDEGARPAAIVLTHAHFDHVGALKALADAWDAPVFAHALEAPYLRGEAAYPPPDPRVGGGLVARLSPLFPRGPVDVGDRLRVLPSDGTVPAMPGWSWVHTPGHTPGHVSLWREADRTLLAGDAFVTTRQESAYAVAVQAPEVHGPPAYFTMDWAQAGASVARLARMEPETVLAGHGRPMRGEKMRRALHALAEDFDLVARPRRGRYLDHPGRAEDGSAYRAP
jgi:glyoxylase-like metal-dependent hydrolase (beta-lactamase superfamily II)